VNDYIKIPRNLDL